MKIGVVIEETWAFFNEIYAELEKHHPTQLYHRRMLHTPVFSERINRFVYRKDLGDFFKSNQVVFFEWAGELLGEASRSLPKTCGIAARLHRYEMYRWADDICWDWVDRIILVSEAKRREFSGRFPDQAHKAVVIPEAVSLKRFSSHPRDFSGEIGILCHLTPRKRVYELILAFHLLCRLEPGYRLHIGGGEHAMFRDYYRALNALVDALELKDKVIFYGDVKDAPSWYDNIDIFISNSYSEGLQVSPMEAIASGRYCLSHCWEGADELLPADALYITNDELVQSILYYSNLSAAEKLERINQQQALVHERFNIDLIKMQVRELIESVGTEWGTHSGA